MAARVARLWTPERVPLVVPLAGLGERAIAYGIDLGIGLITLLALLFLYNVRGDLSADFQSLSPLSMLLLVVCFLAVVLLYDLLFEVWGDGRTLGKRLVGLRVVTQTGKSPDFTTSFVRNILRLVDYFPFFYGVGTLALFFTGTRRIGDLLAHTFVVTERARAQDPFARARDLAGPTGAWPTLRAWTDAQVLHALELLERGAELPRQTQATRCRNFLEHTDPALLSPETGDDEQVILARVCLAKAAAPTGIAAQLLRCTEAEHALRDALARHRRAPSWQSADELDIAIRRAASELMRAERKGAPTPVLERLSLTLLDAERTRRRPRRSGGLLRVLAGDVPAAVYQERHQVARAGVVFLLSIAVGFGLAYANPSLGKALVGEDLSRAIEEGARWTDRIEENATFAQAAVMIIVNNVRVALIAFVLGLLGGIGPLLVLHANGLHFGSVFGYALSLGTAGTLGRFILAHGPTELSAICIAGGAGLCLGRALLAPGRRFRLEALRTEAATGGRMVLAAALMLLVIGGIEGFVSPGSHFPWQLNATVGVVMITLFVLWFRLLGKPAAEAQRRAASAPAPYTESRLR